MKIHRFLFYTACLLSFAAGFAYDVTLVGEMKFAESLARYSITLIDMLKDDLSINFIASRPQGLGSYQDIAPRILRIARNFDKTPGRVALLTDLLWNASFFPARAMPKSTIKIAYSMIESTAIPQKWVHILNKQFDAVVVPDQFLVPVYESSGVKIPVFVLPNALYLDEFLERPIKSKHNFIFTFGVSATFYSRKNLELLVEAFNKEFGSNSYVRLKIHVRRGEAGTEQAVMAAIGQQSNIMLIKKELTKTEYIDFLTSLDCYVLLSKGEGFSITPREALALGIPCIVTDNTSHTTLCATGFVRAVPCPLREPAYYTVFKETCGYHFNCTVQDAQAALRDVYTYYEQYLKKAAKGREWVKRYSHKNLKQRYVTLIKPKQIELGTCNKVKKNKLITTSKMLIGKYLSFKPMPKYA